jgi:indolepyruvate ferredoxin oxidoreductase beta subunit
VTDRLFVVPGTDIARDLGNHRAGNVVLLGALSVFLDLGVDTWLGVIEGRVPPKYVALNRRAFEKGRQAVSS